jgi:hypothetical protein
MAIGPNPRRLEELQIGGGFGEGVDGGADIEKNGTISTDGNVTLKGALSAGSTPQVLTNAAGELDGTKIQAGTVGPVAVDSGGDYQVNNLEASGKLSQSGDYRGISTEDLLGLWRCESATEIPDRTGEGYSLTIGGSGSVVVPGKFGSALSFDGNGHGISSGLPPAWIQATLR